MNTAPLCTIVGMGRGISYAVAQRFAREGFRIGMISRNDAALREFETQISGARRIVADAADEAALRAAVRDLGPAHVLVYNASAGHAGPPSQLTTRDAVADFRVNIVGVLAAVQETLPAMRNAGAGTIFITGGGLALSPMANLASLSLGKAAQRNLAFSLAEELEPTGIHVATITVCGFVQPGTRFAAENIAEEFWRLHAQPAGQFEREVIVK
jgi:short-subunit dehydrogenase